MTEQEARECIHGKLNCMNKCGVFEREDSENKNLCDDCDYCYSQGNFGQQKEAFEVAIKALKEIQQYRAIGTVEELQKAEKEESILKFYYCDSEDSYLVGLRIGNFYYAHYIDGRWIFDMSRHLPWGEHVVDDTTEWKEHTYPSEPKEINFSEWLNGFIKKECGGTVEECRAAVEKQTAKKIVRRKATHEDVESELRDFITRKGMIFRCPTCGCCIAVEEMKSCWECGQKLDWSDEE